MTETAQLTKTEVAAALAWPKITLVTAVFNGVRYIEDTIRSIISQDYPNLEYIIVDGASTDGTVEIIRKYEKHLAWWISEPDRGVYDAINKGFARSTGEIMGWLNASDLLHVGSLFVVGSVFRSFQEVEWLTGRPAGLNEEGMFVYVRPVPHWSRRRYLMGANKHIQQESTFWRRSLWERAGSYTDTSYRAEGDCDLWVRFFRHARLYSVDALIGGWRLHPDSLSHENIARYDQGCDDIVRRELSRTPEYRGLHVLRRISRAVMRVPKVRFVWRTLVLRSVDWCLYNLPSPDWPPVIEYQKDRWGMRGR